MAFRIYSNGGQPYILPPGAPAAPVAGPAIGFTAASLVTDGLIGTDTVTDDLNYASNLASDFVFARFVMLNDGLPPPAPANRPTLRLTSGIATVDLTTSAPTPPDPAIIPPPINVDIFPGLFQEIGAYLFGPNSDGVYLAKFAIRIPQSSWPDPWNWQIQLLNRDPNPRRFVVVFGGSSAETRQSWLHLEPPSIAFSALVDDIPALTEQAVTLRNFGTGPLSGLAFSPALADPYSADPLPATIAPNGSATVGVSFDATDEPVGTRAATAFALTSNDPGASAAPLHNHGLSLSATTRRIETTMLLDVSGSMGAQPDGKYINSPETTRLSVMKSAAKLAGGALSALAAGKGQIGIVRFPGTNSADLTTYDVVPPVVQAAIPSLPNTVVSNPVNALTDGGGTPLKLGLQRVLTGGYFETEASETGLNLRWLLLMTDGDWNMGGNPHPEMTAALGAARVKVFAMGYGTGGEFNPAFLTQIATGVGSIPGGQVATINTSLDPANQAVALANAFKSAVKSVLSSSIDSPRDPVGVLSGGDREQRHPILITPYDTSATFLIHWNTPDRDQMRLMLLSPTCDLITPESAAAGEHPGVTFSGDDRHMIFAVEQRYLAGEDTDGGPDRFGTWRMVVSSDQLGAGEREHYSYDCIVISSLRMDASLDRDQYYAGDTISIRARLTLKGRPLTGASVTVRVTRRGQAFANWLAGVEVNQDDIAAARDQIQTDDISPLYLKAFAATKVKGLAFVPGSFSRTVVLTDDDGDGVYTGSFSETSVPEAYTFLVTAVGTTEDGVVYRRERELPTELGVRPLPEYTIFDIRYVALADNPDIYRAVVSMTPRDQFGNVLLADPGQGAIALRLSGADLDGDLTTAFDGTYSAKIVYGRGADPRLRLIAGDEPVIDDRRVPTPDLLTYVDQVFDYRPGGVVKLDTNRFADPRAMLGDIARRPDDSFLALGGQGSVTVGVQGYMIVAAGDDDVTVFVPPGIDRRAYLVEALATDGQSIWVPLGESPGGTHSFSLRAAGLEAALAIRVTDRSGRTSTGLLEPLDAPGACVLGVGVAKVAEGGRGNLLRNPEFALVGPDGPLVHSSVGGYGPVTAAADWVAFAIHDAEVTTELMTGPGPREAPTLMRVEVSAEGGGIAQVFDGQNRGPKRAVVSAWVYVVRGRVGLGAGPGRRTELTAFSDGAGRWELLSTRNAGAPVSQVSLLATEKGAIFYVAYAELMAADL